MGPFYSCIWLLLNGNILVVEITPPLLP